MLGLNRRRMLTMLTIKSSVNPACAMQKAAIIRA